MDHLRELDLVEEDDDDEDNLPVFADSRFFFAGEKAGDFSTGLRALEEEEEDVEDDEDEEARRTGGRFSRLDGGRAEDDGS